MEKQQTIYPVNPLEAICLSLRDSSERGLPIREAEKRARECGAIAAYYRDCVPYKNMTNSRVR